MTTLAAQPITAGKMANALDAFAGHLDEMGVVPIHLDVAHRKITAHVRGADLDKTGDRFNGDGPPRRYGEDNIERVGSFGSFGNFAVEVYASQREYDAARNVCKACGQPVPAVSE